MVFNAASFFCAIWVDSNPEETVEKSPQPRALRKFAGRSAEAGAGASPKTFLGRSPRIPSSEAARESNALVANRPLFAPGARDAGNMWNGPL